MYIVVVSNEYQLEYEIKMILFAKECTLMFEYVQKLFELVVRPLSYELNVADNRSLMANNENIPNKYQHVIVQRVEVNKDVIEVKLKFESIQDDLYLR